MLAQAQKSCLCGLAAVLLHSERAWFTGRLAAFASGVDAVQHRRQTQHARQLQRAWRVIL